MSQRPHTPKLSKNYALKACHHQYLNEKAVELTLALKLPVACRDVLDAILTLSTDIEDEELVKHVKKRLNGSN